MPMHRAALAAMISLVLPTAGGAAQTIEERMARANVDADQVSMRAREWTAYIQADRAQSQLCKSFEGKSVTPVRFDTFAAQISGAKENNEFETTAQYQARQTAASAVVSAKPAVIAIPINHAFVHYDADSGAMLFSAGTFPTKAYSTETQAEIAATIAVMQAKHAIDLKIAVASSNRVLGTVAARNIIGAPVQIKNIERHTSAVAVPGAKLFNFAASDTSLVMGYGIAPAQAAKIKTQLRGALVLMPSDASVARGSMNGAKATAQRPEHFTELSTVIVTRPKCALILDPQSRVVATADTAAD